MTACSLIVCRIYSEGVSSMTDDMLYGNLLGALFHG